jgi:hypothetical protein
LNELHGAIETNNIEQIIDSAYAFGRADLNVEVCLRCGCPLEFLVGIWGIEKEMACTRSHKQGEKARKRKLLTSPNELRLLRFVYLKLRGPKPPYRELDRKLCEEIANELCERYNIKNEDEEAISYKTVQRRCVEHRFEDSTSAVR